MGMSIGIGLGITTQRRRGAAQIITAIIAPALGPLEDGDTIASAMSANYDQTSNYASTEGTITSVVAAATVNGSAALFTDTVDAGDVVVVTVTITDSEANERVFNAGSRTVAGIAPTNDVAPSIAGDTGLGDTLTVTAGSWSGVPAPTLAYQWLRGGVEIAGETGTTYDITLADSGADISVRETATNSEGSAFEVSNAITADVFTAPVNTVAPSISGDTDPGATLTRTEGTWTGNPTPTLSGQWQRDGVAISGATGTTYEIALADDGADITYLETATNAVDSASQVSNAITVDTLAAPDAFTAPDWDVAHDEDTVSVNILTLPADGGAAITDLEYRVNAGAAVSLGETTTGSYPITADEGDDIQIRAVNAVGPGDWSDVKAVPAGETFDPDALAYITAVETADGQSLEAGVKDAINDFVVGCKADAIWDALKASCILAGARTLNGCLVPLVGTSPTNFNFVTADYNRKTGLKGDGSTKYLDSNRRNNDDPQDSNHNAVYVTERQTGQTGIYISDQQISESSRRNQIGETPGSSSEVFFRNRAWQVATAENTKDGLIATSRESSGGFFYHADELSLFLTRPSQDPGDDFIRLFRRGNEDYANARLSFYSIGEAIDLSALDTRVSTLMAAIDGAIT